MAAEDLERTIQELNAAMQALVAAINPAAAAQLEKTKADREYVADIKKLNKEAEDARKKAIEKEKNNTNKKYLLIFESNFLSTKEHSFKTETYTVDVSIKKHCIVYFRKKYISNNR